MTIETVRLRVRERRIANALTKDAISVGLPPDTPRKVLEAILAYRVLSPPNRRPRPRPHLRPGVA
jgi:hypothetical protein